MWLLVREEIVVVGHFQNVQYIPKMFETVEKTLCDDEEEDKLVQEEYELKVGVELRDSIRTFATLVSKSFQSDESYSDRCHYCYYCLTVVFDFDEECEVE
jgi:hypothetical protein